MKNSWASVASEPLRLRILHILVNLFRVACRPPFPLGLYLASPAKLARYVKSSDKTRQTAAHAHRPNLPAHVYRSKILNVTHHACADTEKIWIWPRPPASVSCQVDVIEVFTPDIAANLRIVTYTDIYLCSEPEEFRLYLLKNGNSNNSECTFKAFIKLVMCVHPLYSVVSLLYFTCVCVRCLFR